MKRIFDCVVSSILLVVTAPLSLIAVFFVRLGSAGPVIFKQERVGRHGTSFHILKFRSMQVVPADSQGPLVTSGRDPRITRAGHFLRSTKLDELPQLINVVRGDMSLVGPRPEVAKYVDLWVEEQQELILSVRPGITDPASIKFRREAELLTQQDDPEKYYVDTVLPRKAAIYVEYVLNQSFLGDIKIMWRTVGAVFKD